MDHTYVNNACKFEEALALYASCSEIYKNYQIKSIKNLVVSLSESISDVERVEMDRQVMEVLEEAFKVSLTLEKMKYRSSKLQLEKIFCQCVMD